MVEKQVETQHTKKSDTENEEIQAQINPENAALVTTKQVNSPKERSGDYTKKEPGPKVQLERIEEKKESVMTETSTFADEPAAQASFRQEKGGRAQKNALQLEAMLQTPTNNFGLASLFKNFVLIGEQY